MLDLDDFSAEEIAAWLDCAEGMKDVLRRPIKKVPALQGVTLVNLFYENSTRTRVSFELAAKYLSADVVNMTASASSVTKGESLVDTLLTLQALGTDMVVMRHSQSGAPYLARQYLKGSVLNAGDGWHAHPTQALLDLYTIRERLGRLAGLRVAIVGDILHSRVARSNVWGLTRAGAEVVLCGPPTLLPPDLIADARFQIADSSNGYANGHSNSKLKAQNSPPPELGPILPPVRVEYEIDRALADADVVMALRLQAERQQAGLLPSLREYVVLYQINAARLRRAAPNALVMHPGPMNEGIEIAADVAHGPRSLIEEQVTNGVAVRMAALYLLAGADLTPQPPSLKGRESQGLLSPGALGEGPGGRAAHEPAVGS